MDDKKATEQLEFFKKAWEQFPIPVVISDSKGRFVLVNGHFANSLGLSIEEMIGKTIREFCHPDEVDRDMHELIRMQKGEIRTYSIDKRYRRVDGNYLWFHLNAQPIFNDQGQVIYIVGCYTDITHRKSVSDSIFAQAQGQLSILNSSNYAIIGTDMDGMITSFNPAAERILGYTRTEIIDSCNFNLFLDLFETFEHVQTLSQELNREIEPGFPAVVERTKIHGGDESQWTLVDKQRHRHIVSLSIAPMINANSIQEGFLFIARDISVQKSMEKKMEEQRISLVNSSRLASLGEMAAGIAHEINNPLAIIIGKTDRILNLMGKAPLDSVKVIQEIEKIKTTAHRIAKIVSGLRSFSRSGENDPMIQVNADQIVQETLGLCSEKFKISNVRIEINLDPNCVIDCRDTQISQVLLNLLSNAFDAIQTQSDKWVKVILCETDDIVEISVEDCGLGIPENIAKRIMQPFFTTKEIGKGTGLGLSISQGIVVSHGGKIYLDRESEHTRFVIELPRSKKSQKVNAA